MPKFTSFSPQPDRIGSTQIKPEPNIIILLIVISFFLFSNSNLLFAQEGKFIQQNQLLFDDPRLSKYILKLKSDSLDSVISFITRDRKGYTVQKVRVNSAGIYYFDKYGSIKKKTIKKQYELFLKDYYDFYVFEPINKASCDEIHFVIFKAGIKFIVISSYSCQLHDYFLIHKTNPFKINRKIFQLIQDARLEHF